MKEIQATFYVNRDIIPNSFDMMIPSDLVPCVGEYIKIPTLENLDELYLVLEVRKLFYVNRMALEITVE